MPLDLTGMLVVATAIAAFPTLHRANYTLGRTAASLLLGLAALLVLGMLNKPLTPYGAHKTTSLLLVTLPTILLTVVILRNQTQWLRLVWSFAILGPIIALLAIAVLLLGSQTGLRFTGGQDILLSGPINVSRASALGLLSILVLLSRARPRRPLHTLGPLTLGLASAIGLWISGTRAPVLAVFIALVAVLSVTQTKARFFKLIIIGLAISALALAPSLLQVDPRPAQRILTTFDANEVLDGQSRLLHARYAIASIASSPAPAGWGNYAPTVEARAPLGPYPHNLLLEVFVELGWLGGVALLSFCFGLLRYLLSIQPSPARDIAFGVITLVFFNALFSGDLNGNREFLALGLAGINYSEICNGRLCKL